MEKQTRGNFYFTFLSFGWREPIHVCCCGVCDSCMPIYAVWTFRYGGMVFTGEKKVMAELREGQEMDCSVAFKTASGNVAAYEKGSVQWSSSDESLFTVQQGDDDETKATVLGVNGSENGSGTLECRADGDPDADQTRELIFTAAITVTQGEAVTGDITFGAPHDPAQPK